jgi:diguanylate cyclase (GGDEF)-like protein/PAS domain S-box-containing protein
MYFKNKKISFKIFLFLYIFLVSTFSFISYSMFIENYQESETNKNLKDINILLSNMSSTMKHIQNVTNDYAYWDETYDFIEKHNKSYINENFRKGTSTLGDMELDFIIYVDLNHNIIYSTYNDNNKINNAVKFESKVIKIALNSREFNSLFKMDENIFYLRKSKIVNSDGKSSFNGYMYSGKFINNKMIKSSQYSFKTSNINISEKENYMKKEEIGYLHNVSISTKIEKEYFINNIDFFDIFNNYVFTLELKNTMDILASGKRTILFYNVTIALLLLVIFIILSRAQHNLYKDNSKLEREIEKRTKKLNEYLNIVNKYVTISSTDLDGNITEVSEAFCRISGYSREELIGQPHSIVKHTDTDPIVYKELWESITEGKKWDGEVKNRKKNGGEYWVLAHIDPLYSDSGKKIGYTSIRQEITDKKRVEKLSVTDKLTQLYNRVKLEEVFTIEIAKFGRYNSSFSMILIDIDHFKEVNDEYGHNVGDIILKEFANILKISIRVEDVVGRWGGEEFIILSSNYSTDGVMSLAEKIRKNIESYEFTTVGHKTASFGISIVNKEDTQETMIARADRSLYHAKHTGRNKICLH